MFNVISLTGNGTLDAIRVLAGQVGQEGTDVRSLFEGHSYVQLVALLSTVALKQNSLQIQS